LRTPAAGGRSEGQTSESVASRGVHISHTVPLNIWWRTGDYAKLWVRSTLTTSPNSAGLYSQQRTVPRYTFVATSEITDPVNAMRLSGKVMEISRKGCYLDALNVLPLGAVLHLLISCDQGAFATQAKVIYVQEHIGMGIAFLDTPEDQLQILDSWLANLA
jgi:hypothetical protein